MTPTFKNNSLPADDRRAVARNQCWLGKKFNLLVALFALNAAISRTIAAPAAAESIPSRDTPAHVAALRFMRGINLGNDLEYAAGNGAGGLTYSAADFDLIRAEGFDHVRIPVAWHLYAGPAPNFTITNSIFTRADALVNNALNRGLAVLLDLHHFNEFTAKPTANTNEFYAIWKQVAAHYASRPANFAFELLNEPNDAATTTVLNPIYAETIRLIRLTNPGRTIFVGPGEFNSIDQLSFLSLPKTDLNLIVTVHCYDPYYFTHQGAEWALPDTAITGVLFPGPPTLPIPATDLTQKKITHTWVFDWFKDYNVKPTSVNPSSSFAFRAKLQRAKTWSDRVGRPIHVGEFGCYEKADAQSRVNFYREIRTQMETLGLGWAMWDWKAGFHYIKNGRPEPAGMRDAMFPPPVLNSPALGSFEIQGAAGKSYRVSRTPSLSAPIDWTAIATQMLTAPVMIFNDVDATNQAGGYYRVEWLK